MRIFIFFITLLLPLSAFAQSYQSSFKKSMEAYKNKQYPEMLYHVRDANQLRTDHQTIMYYLAMAYALEHQPDSANYWLRKVISIDARNYAIDISEFEELKATSGYESLISYQNFMQLPVINSDTAFVVPDPQLHIEDVAFDPYHNTFLVSSINRKNIFTTIDGDMKPIFPNSFPVGITGMHVQDSILWFTGAGFPESGLAEDDPHLDISKLYRASLNSYQLMDSFAVKGNEPHMFGDLFITQDGEILVSDSRANIIYMLTDQTLEVWLQPEGIFSIQGMSEMGGYIFFADYVTGLYAVDKQTKMTHMIAPAEDLSLKGIDGLYTYGGSLITIQNGVQPNRVSRLFLNEDLTAVENFQYLEKNHPAAVEPTLGYVDDGYLYYVTGSFWPLNKNGVIDNPEQLQPVVLKLKLP